MDPILKQVENVKDEVCITLILNTHRTSPDNDRDSVLLKNLQKEAEKIMTETLNKRLAWHMIERLEDQVAKIDHRHNTESMVVFVSESVSLYTRLPMSVSDRAVVARNFVTRDLFRATHLRQGYYTLVLKLDRVRLIEAADGRVVEELGRPFPLINRTLFPFNEIEATNAGRVTNLQKEFFRQVDEALWAVWRDNPLPVVIAADEKAYSHFCEVSLHGDMIIGVFNDSYDKPAQQIVDANWHIVEQYTHDKNDARIIELKESLNSGNVLFDINDIWLAVSEGRGKTLFVRNGFYMPAKIINDVIVPFEENAGDNDIIGDVIDEIIEVNARYGGDAVFVFDGGLDQYGGLALVTRY